MDTNQQKLYKDFFKLDLFKINHNSTDINETHRQGFIDISYDELVAVLGEPDTGYDKSQAHWKIEYDGIVATIYDYKEVKLVEKITDWHIGGKSVEALRLVSYIFLHHKVSIDG